MKEQFKESAFHFIPHLQGYTNREVSMMNYNELSDYYNELIKHQHTQLYIMNDNFILYQLEDVNVLIPEGQNNQLSGFIVINDTFSYLVKQFHQASTIYDVILKTREAYHLDSYDEIYDFVDRCLNLGILVEYRGKE